MHIIMRIAAVLIVLIVALLIHDIRNEIRARRKPRTIVPHNLS